MHICSHLIYAIFAGNGLFRLLEHLYAGLKRVRVPPIALDAVVALLLLLALAGEVQANYELNEYSADVAIKHFYYIVFRPLPEGSVLLDRGGVFGYDMFYSRYVYDIRPDVFMPVAGPASCSPLGRVWAGGGEPPQSRLQFQRTTQGRQ